MKMLLLILLNLILMNQSQAMGWLGNAFSGNSNTEAGTCVECERRAFQGRPLSAINASFAQGEGSLAEALQHFQLYAKNNAVCRASSNEAKYGMISDFSNGTSNNLTHIVKVDSSGKVTIMDSFRTGEGWGRGSDGVGNDCGSHQSPHGFIKMGTSDYRADTKNPDTGDPSSWPQCGALNSGFQDNRIYLSGLELGYNDNLGGEANPRLCPNNKARDARLHPISYDAGNTTQGCKGMPLDKWCKWAPKLRGGCIYNYDGSESPAIRALQGRST